MNLFSVIIKTITPKLLTSISFLIQDLSIDFDRIRQQYKIKSILTHLLN